MENKNPGLFVSEAKWLPIISLCVYSGGLMLTIRPSSQLELAAGLFLASGAVAMFWFCSYRSWRLWLTGQLDCRKAVATSLFALMTTVSHVYYGLPRFVTVPQ